MLSAISPLSSCFVPHQKWLRERDWSDVKDNYKVDRRTIPVLNTAQNLIHGDAATTVPLSPVAVPAKEIPASQIPGNIGVSEVISKEEACRNPAALLCGTT